MKLAKTLLAATILATAGAASAASIDEVSSSANVRVTVNNGVATLHGNVDNNFERVQAASKALQIDGVNRVLNLITYSK